MTFEADDNLAQISGSPMISDGDFVDLIAKRARKLLWIARFLSARCPDPTALTRPLVSDLLSQSIQLKELLDAYGARNNRQWCRFRSLTATIKLFADVTYELLHIQYFLPCYRLLPIERDFAAATARSLELTHDVLIHATGWLLAQSHRLGLPVPADELYRENYAEDFPPGRLPNDRAMRRIKSASETVTHLATAYLNLAAESDLLTVVEKVEPKEYAACFPDPISENNLRSLKVRFHSLQSLYDTYVSETDIEHLDGDLPILRGHISIVYHLLEMATQLVHYYERHLDTNTGDATLRRKSAIAPKALLSLLMDYSIAYAGLYLRYGRCLCQNMLKRYAEIGRIKAPVPSYRGFHVRPSTLIARIVRHYGSDIRMELDDQSYDASSPMDIFRANEKINAQKRRWLASEIGRLPLPKGDLSENLIRTTVLNLVLKLTGQGKLIIYQQPLQLSNEFNSEGILLEQVTAEIGRLLATGQIDIKTDLSITFTGDKRVLSDLELLAKSGYGEDHFGNNITLPKELAYLRR
ncbi:MAG TPA: HPr family phosphocarrier protein [Xanthomonadaceae bacterium]|nr:HPr family phosphocarrier protein [Xanthomonadaceae bacterium]